MRPVIICGGVGTKMWPMSRVDHPKHFLKLFDGKSLFQINYEALREKFRPQEIYIQTTVDQMDLVSQQAPDIPKDNCFVEPELRNTGPAAGYMALMLEQKDPDEPFFLVQADVLRTPTNKFLEMIEETEKLVKKEGKMVTGGFRPDFGVMGVDYLVCGPKLVDTAGVDFYKIQKFLWRSTKEEADKYIQEKSILVHANHYSWTPKALLEAYKTHAPNWYESLQKIKTCIGERNGAGVREVYSEMEKGPTEDVTQHIFEEGYVALLPFDWVDFGTWESFFKYRAENKQYMPGDNVLEMESNGCYVQKADKNFVALVGVDDLFVVDTDDALLVCKKDMSGKVGDIVKYLKEKGKKEYL